MCPTVKMMCDETNVYIVCVYMCVYGVHVCVRLFALNAGYIYCAQLYTHTVCVYFMRTQCACIM